MFHEIKIRDMGDGWFEILERSTPTSSFQRVATVWGERRAEQVKELFSSPLANPVATAAA